MTVQIEIDEKLLAEVDSVTFQEKISRVDFIQKALKDALRRRTIEDKEQRVIEGYRLYPVQSDEFEIEDEQMEEFWKQV